MLWCKVRRFCFGPCATELKVGSLVIASLGLIVNSFIFSNILIRYFTMNDLDWHRICSEIIFCKSWETSVYHLKWLVASLCLLALVEILVCALLVIGVNRRKLTLFIPYLIWTALNITSRAFICMIAFIICVFFSTSNSFINLLFWVSSLLVNVYFFIVVNSHALELNETFRN